MQFATFWACVRLVSQTISTLPLGLYLRRDDGANSAGNHPLYALIHDMPNADQTAAEFWEGALAFMCVWGNAFAEKVFNDNGRLIALILLRPHLMSMHRDLNGALHYRYSEGSAREFTEEQIFHIRGFGFGGDLGLSPVSYARQTRGAAMAADEAAARTFAKMRPGGFFTYEAPDGKPKTLTPEQRAQAKSVLVDPYTGSENAAKVDILEAVSLA
jgi:HK97 family phage portal protein